MCVCVCVCVYLMGHYRENLHWGITTSVPNLQLDVFLVYLIRICIFTRTTLLRNVIFVPWEVGYVLMLKCYRYLKKFPFY